MRDLWYSGLRVVDVRSLTRDDISAISDIRRERYMRSIVGLGLPLSIIALGCIAYVVFDRHEILQIAFPAAIAGALAFRPWRTLPAIQRHLAALGEDETHSDVLVCKGVGGELVFAMDEERRLQPAILLRGARDQALTVEVLPRSGAVLTVNGQSTRAWNQMQQGTTAPKSDHARAAANFVSDLSGRGEIAIGERTLSQEELGELIAHAPMLSVVDLFLATSLGTLAVVSWWHAVKTDSPTLLLPVVSSIIAIWLILRAFRRWKSHRRFGPDIACGRVIIVRELENGMATGSPIEYLALSGILWSAGDQAAAWRRLPLARGTYMRRGGA